MQWAGLLYQVHLHNRARMVACQRRREDGVFSSLFKLVMMLIVTTQQ